MVTSESDVFWRCRKGWHGGEGRVGMIVGEKSVFSQGEGAEEVPG